MCHGTFKGIFGFCDHDKVLYGVKIRFQLQRNDNENRLLFGVGSAFGDENKFVIDEMSWTDGRTYLRTDRHFPH